MGIEVFTPFTRISDHELRYLAQTTQVPIVSQASSSTLTTEGVTTAFISNSTNFKLPPPEEPKNNFINGDLIYLYRQPIKPFRPIVRRRYVIQQLRWKAGRYKSLT